MTKSAPKADAAKRRPGGLAVKAAVGALLLGALSALPLCMILVPGMMPSLVVLFVDRGRPRYLSYSVAVMNFAGVLPFLLSLVGHMTLTAAAAKLSDPLTWLVTYGAAGAGWVICAVTPFLARTCVEILTGPQRR